MIHDDAQPTDHHVRLDETYDKPDTQPLLDQLVAGGLVVDELTITEQGNDVWMLTATVTGGVIRRLAEPDHAVEVSTVDTCTTAGTVQRDRVLDWLALLSDPFLALAARRVIAGWSGCLGELLPR